MLEADVALQRIVIETGAAPLLEPLRTDAPFKAIHSEETGIIVTRTLVELGNTPEEAAADGLGAWAHDNAATATGELTRLTNRRDRLSAEELAFYRSEHTYLGEQRAMDAMRATQPGHLGLVVRALFQIRNHHADTDLLWRIANGPEPHASFARATLLTQAVDFMHAVTTPRPYGITDCVTRSEIIGTQSIEAAQELVIEQMAAVSTLYGEPIVDVVPVIGRHLRDVRALRAA